MQIHAPALPRLTWWVARRWDLTPRKAVVVAHALSLSRGPFAVALGAGYLLDAPGLLLVALVTCLWVSDALDGEFARYGYARGEEEKVKGQALDPIMDDVGFVVGFALLLDAGLVPLWFLASLLTTRVLFAMIRLVALARLVDERLPPSFPRAVALTKLNGVSLAVGQIVLFLALAGADAGLSHQTITTAMVAMMSTTTVVSVFHFTVRRNWSTVRRLLEP